MDVSYAHARYILRKYKNIIVTLIKLKKKNRNYAPKIF